MRQALASLVLTGCSLIYNPNDLPARVDAMPDMQQIIDANPGALALTGVAPVVLHEGTGDGGSRWAVVVIEGSDIAQTGVTVEIVAAASATKTPMLALNTSNIQVDAYGHHVAVPVQLPVDTNLAKNESIALDVRVTQDAGGTPVSVTLSGMLTLQGYDEYDAIAPLANDANVFSRVLLDENDDGALPLPAAGPLYLHSNSSIAIHADVVVSVDGGVLTPGPSGGAGGAGGPSDLLGQPGASGEGPSGGAPGMNAGPWIGDDSISSLTKVQNHGSGGGGGMSSNIIGLSQRGGGGGGGGGSIELFAAGTIELASVSAKGGDGETANVANPGGDGSGGAIVVRAGTDVAISGTLDVSGSHPGRVRVDAGGMLAGAPGDAYRGPSFKDLPLIINSERPTITVVGGASTAFHYIVIHGDDIEGPHSLTMGANGQRMFELASPLKQGLNELCLLVEPSAGSPTRNCAPVGHIFKTP